MRKLEDRVWRFCVQPRYFNPALFIQYGKDCFSTVSFSVISYLHKEALCGCVDILLAEAIQCSVKFFMCA